MLGKGLRCFTLMKSLICHMKKTSRSQTGSRHLTQSGVKLKLSLLVGDFDRMETRMVISHKCQFFRVPASRGL